MRKSNNEYQKKLNGLEQEVKNKEKEFCVKESKLREEYDAQIEKLYLLKDGVKSLVEISLINF